jgi:hypothetical protein
MNHLSRLSSILILAAFASLCTFAGAQAVQLDLPCSGTDPEKIDYDSLPRLTGVHAVVSAATLDEPNKQLEKFDMHHLRFQLHNYLLHHAGQYWCIWSDGPPVEDEPTQEVRYATSKDGLHWSAAKPVTGKPDAPYGFIARDFWVRDGELLALAAHYKGKGAFGADKELQLQAYVWNQGAGNWRFKQKLRDDSINNFAPQRLASGDWITTSRDSRFNVSMIIGGRAALDDWRSYPVVNRGEVAKFSPDEPIIWQLPDKTLFALFRDNGGSLRIFQSLSTDKGKSWSKPVMSNFPNTSSKIYSMATSRGYRVLVSNAHPKAARRELYLSVSTDGRKFTRMARLEIPSPPPNEELTYLRQKFAAGIASLQYPHVLEHDGKLLIAFSRGKKQTEVLVVPLDSIDALLK